MKKETLERAGFCVKDGEGRDVRLAMQELWLTGHVLPVGARLLVRHVFRSAERKPLEVVYAFVLPRDAALKQFRIEGDGFKVTSDLRPVKEAQELYEKGLEDGHLATLAKQYGDGIVNLAVGNLMPDEQVTVFLEVLAGVESRDDGFRFRFPFTMAPTYHPKARMIEVKPGVGEQELPEDEFGDLLLPPFHRDAGALHRIGFDLSVQSPAGSTAYFGPPLPRMPRFAAASPRSAGVMCCCEPSAPLARPRAMRSALLKSVARSAEPAHMDTEDLLVALASRLEPDGGMPGGSEKDRLAASLLALLFFMENGHGSDRGTFRTHVRRLIDYIDAAGLAGVLVETKSRMVEVLLARMRGGEKMPGDHEAMVREVIEKRRVPVAALWRELEGLL